MTQLLARTADARVMLIVGFHTGRPIVVRFLDKAERLGLGKSFESSFAVCANENDSTGWRDM